MLDILKQSGSNGWKVRLSFLWFRFCLEIDMHFKLKSAACIGFRYEGGVIVLSIS